ncbi:MAG: Fur family transcriptional regulator [Bacillus sp. (in: firmicutes)]
MALKEIILALKRQGIKVTAQRRAILEYLITHTTHPTAAEIYHELEGIYHCKSISTVYNNLHVFKKAGVVRELAFGDTASRFELCKENHYHVICLDCGIIEDFRYPSLYEVEQIAEKVTGLHINNHHFELYGYCRNCTGTS